MSIFIRPEDSFLNMSVAEISVEEIRDGDTQAIIDYMIEVACGQRGDTDKGVMVGLAAPQIGIGKPIILVDMGVDADRKDLGQLQAFINPRIVWHSVEQEEGREGCYSVDRRVAGIVSRPVKIKFTALDRHANPIEAEITGFTARIFQHEVDHLRGIRFPDIVGPEGVLQWVEEDKYSEYKGEWRNWPVRCPWDVWQKMKEGQPYAEPSRLTENIP